MEDFWKFAVDPTNALKMNVIAEGAKLFAEELDASQKVRNVEYEAYPMDNFSVIVSFSFDDEYVSLNLENIQFSNEGVYAEKKVYVWREGARTVFLILGQSPEGSTHVERQLILSMTPEKLANPSIFKDYALKVKYVYEDMYNALCKRINLPCL